MTTVHATRTGGLTTDRLQLIARGKRLEYVTIAYNCIEGVVALGTGLLAGSVALVGFGFDSGIEVFSALALLWRLQSDADEARRARIEKRALRVVGASFLLLAAYVTLNSSRSLLFHLAPKSSSAGIVLAAASVVVMPLLMRAKKRVARGLGSAALDADATQTEFCAYLSAILLAGLGLNALFGWWWADSAAALVMVPLIVREGWEGICGVQCGNCCAGPGLANSKD
ncbi:MAG: cation transporter [Thermoanaerobaculia bacterium]